MRFSHLWLLAAVLGTACDQAVQPVEPEVAGSPSLKLSDEERTLVFRFDDSGTAFEPCFGEDVFFEFHRQVVIFFRGDVTHGHFKLKVIDLGSTLTGLTSGTVWTLHGTFGQSANGDFTAPETPGEFTAVTSQVLTSPGSGVNLQIRERIHITIAPDETVTVDRSTLDVVCR
jgi:hypothetical protein